MDSEERKRDMLRRLAEDGMPAKNDPWPALESRMRRQRARRALTGELALLAGLLALVFLLTPPGQAAAQGVLRFFQRAGGETLPLPAGQPTEAIPPTSTTAPTRYVGLEAAGTPVVTVTTTPLPTIAPQGPDASVWTADIAAVQPQVAYPIRALPAAPPGYALENVVYLPGEQLVQQIYKYRPYQSGEMFIFSQQPTPPGEVIGQSAAVAQVEIDGVAVEVVDGSWFTAAGADRQQWQAGAPVHSFRWQQDGFYFELEFWVNETFSPAYLEPDDMQAMVEVAMGKRDAFPDYPLRLDLQNLSIAQAEEQAGFDVLAPAILPEGFAFIHAAYDPSMRLVVLYYEPRDGTRATKGTSLIVIQTDRDPRTVWDGYPPEAMEMVKVGDAGGLLVTGSMINERYEADGAMFLEWHTPQRTFTLRFFSPDSNPLRLSKEDLLKIAESMQ